VLFIITQQVQPFSIMQAMHAQQAWIISQHFGSPLVQVMQTPSLVDSHLHMPMVMLQVQTTMPFIIMQQVHIPPASIVQRFCTMLVAILSSQEQTIFMPPVHFSIFTVQRGTIMKLAVGMAVGAPIGVPIAGIPICIPVRSIIMRDMASPFIESDPPADPLRVAPSRA
jgi:hypothetical protein